MSAPMASALGLIATRRLLLTPASHSRRGSYTPRPVPTFVIAPASGDRRLRPPSVASLVPGSDRWAPKTGAAGFPWDHGTVSQPRIRFRYNAALAVAGVIATI